MGKKPIHLTRRGDTFYWGIRGFIVRKFGSIALVMSLVHLIEDAILVGLGRYTEINFFIVLIGTIIFGLVMAGISRIPVVKIWLGKD